MARRNMKKKLSQRRSFRMGKGKKLGCDLWLGPDSALREWEEQTAALAENDNGRFSREHLWQYLQKLG